MLHPRSLGNVVCDDAQALPVAVQDDAAARLDLQERAVLAPVLPLPDETATLSDGLLDVAVHAPPVMGDDVVERHAPEFCFRVAERRLEGRVRLHYASRLDVDQADILRGLLYYGAVE